MTGAELTAARRRAGLSQAALGARAGVPRPTVAYWERRPWVDLGWHASRLLLRELVRLGAFDGPPLPRPPSARAGGEV